YDRHLGPVLFAPYADDLVSRLKLRDTSRVLEVASGTGVVTAKLLAKLPPRGRLVATDLNQPMLDHARGRLPADPRLELRTADAQQLPFADASFDHYVCQFGIMFFPDKAGALREARRVLAPGGEVIVNTWSTLADNSFARIGHTVTASFFDKDPPTFYLTPFGWHDQAVIRDTFAAAGFTKTTIDVVDIATSAVSAKDFAIGVVRGNPIAVAIQERLGDAHDRVIDAVAKELAKEGGASPWRGRMRALVVRAVK
ncbi:MAG TPA: methyltransferase domain-containing protein, partial [Xanthomonadales bacterium]|nr:methyltransferase domain-containing protein [Xanthomonadales bacterium]